MDIKTRAIVTVDPKSLDKNTFEEVLNMITVVRSCANCYHADWNADKTAVKCGKFNAAPPLWAVAMGCDAFDYLPF